MSSDLPAPDVPGALAAATALAAVAHEHAQEHDGGGEGLCLPVAAALGHALTARGIDAQAVTGTLYGEAHWWVEVHGHRIDPTRHQFDDRHDLLYPPDDPDYIAEARYPCAWTAEEVIAEAQRAFVYADAAEQWARPLVADLAGSAQSS